jgi:glycosyltransferase involved in cell wall biosynthesis
VALCLGSIYPNKRPRYLIEAADEIKRALPGFHLIVVGDGPSRAILDAASVTREWLHPVGMLKGKPMVEYASIASLLLNPGLVGLSVLDAFALRLPMVTCDLELHSPEIEYLRDGYNGLILPRNTSPKEYGEQVVKMLTDEALVKRLQSGCIESADEYSIESMVENFTAGILAALAAGS